jgi:uncharacterized membrane protein
VAVAACALLVALSVGWEWLWAPLRSGGTWWGLKALPLALALPGLWRMRLYTYRWMSLLVWLYFMEGVVRAWSDAAPSRYFALAAVALSSTVFVACVAHARLRLGPRSS